MTTSYPITEQRSLDPAAKRGPLGLGRRSRDDDELPKPNAHEVLVYRVNGQYIVDNARRGAAHEQVVNASHVSVVDLSRDTPVMVRLEIPSCEASAFTIQVTFVCTVNDPAVVVREGLRDAETVLASYLRSHHRIFELGQDFRIEQINDVRRDVTAQVMAYTMMSPPIEPGMLIRLASVEVLTPDELVEFEKKRRAQRQETTLESERIDLSHLLDRGREHNEYALNDLRQRHAQDLEDIRQQHGQDSEYRQKQQQFLIETEEQRHNQMLAAERGSFEREELTKIADLISTDPVRAVQLAYAAGQLNPMEFADQLRDHAERQQTREREDRLRLEQQERDDRLRLQQQDHEDRLLRLQHEREDKLRELELQYEDRHLDREELRIRAKAEREDRRQQELWRREDRRQQDQSAQEDKRQQLEANLRVFSELIQRGSFDNVAIDIDKANRLINSAIDIVQAKPLESTPAKELSDSGEPPQDDDDVDTREEDAS